MREKNGQKKQHYDEFYLASTCESTRIYNLNLSE